MASQTVTYTVGMVNPPIVAARQGAAISLTTSANGIAQLVYYPGTGAAIEPLAAFLSAPAGYSANGSTVSDTVAGLTYLSVIVSAGTATLTVSDPILTSLPVFGSQQPAIMASQVSSLPVISPVAFAGNQQATVVFPAVYGAKVYTVTPGTNSALAVQTSASSVTMPNLTNGVPVYFTVTTDNGASGTTSVVTPRPQPATLSAAAPPVAMWLDANQINGVGVANPANLAVVSTWQDVSGNGFNGTTVASPTYLSSWTNGKPALTLNGSSQYITTALTPAIVGSQATVFIALSLNSQASAGGSVAYTWFDYRGQNRLDAIANAGVNNWRWFAGSNNIVNSSGTYATGAISIVSLVSPGFYYTQGTKMSNVGGNLWGQNALLIGANSGPALFWPGPIAEMIVYAGKMNDADRHLVETYLGTKYNVTMAVQ